jgi:hypothetical protein
VLFALALIAARRSTRFEFLTHASSAPTELWVLAAAGTLATIAGIADWRFHRSGGVAMGRNERRAEFAALALGGLPLFALMTVASFIHRPRALLLPVVAALTATVVMICYDEFVFHRRRCGPLETLYHRALVFGHGVALAAWMHFVFVRDGFAHA